MMKALSYSILVLVCSLLFGSEGSLLVGRIWDIFASKVSRIWEADWEELRAFLVN
jgi:hypothetical protein